MISVQVLAERSGRLGSSYRLGLPLHVGGDAPADLNLSAYAVDGLLQLATIQKREPNPQQAVFREPRQGVDVPGRLATAVHL